MNFKLSSSTTLDTFQVFNSHKWLEVTNWTMNIRNTSLNTDLYQIVLQEPGPASKQVISFHLTNFEWGPTMYRSCYKHKR
jgi:hypothetical protein